MAYRKSTIRHYGPVTKRYAKLLNEMESVLRKGKNLLAEINRLELASMALILSCIVI